MLQTKWDLSDTFQLIAPPPHFEGFNGHFSEPLRQSVSGQWSDSRQHFLFHRAIDFKTPPGAMRKSWGKWVAFPGFPHPQPRRSWARTIILISWSIEFLTSQSPTHNSQGYLEGVSRPRMTLQRSWSWSWLGCCNAGRLSWAVGCQIAITQQQKRRQRLLTDQKAIWPLPTYWPLISEKWASQGGGQFVGQFNALWSLRGELLPPITFWASPPSRVGIICHNTLPMAGFLPPPSPSGLVL